jgi:hypothetical protein
VRVKRRSDYTSSTSGRPPICPEQLLFRGDVCGYLAQVIASCRSTTIRNTNEQTLFLWRTLFSTPGLGFHLESLYAAAGGSDSMTTAIMAKSLVVTATLIAICCGAVVAVADRFPDQTWRALHRLPRVYAWFFPPDAPPRVRLPIPAPVTPPYTDADGYAVMSAWKHYWTQKHVVFVRRDIKPDPYYSPDVSCLSSAYRAPYRDAVKDFAWQWSEHQTLENQFIPAEEFRVVPESELPPYEIRKGVPANAGGYFAFSAVGFNADRTRAAVYVLHRDGVYGTGSLWLVRKTRSGVWVVVPGGGCIGWMS